MISLKNRNGSKNGSAELKKAAAATGNGSVDPKTGPSSNADPSRTESSDEFKNSSAPPRPGSGDLKNGGGAKSSKHGTPKSKNGSADHRNGGGGLFAVLKTGKNDVWNEQPNSQAAAGDHKNAKSEKFGHGCEESPRDKNGGGSKSGRNSACQLSASNGAHHTTRQYIH